MYTTLKSLHEDGYERFVLEDDTKYFRSGKIVRILTIEEGDIAYITDTNPRTVAEPVDYSDFPVSLPKQESLKKDFKEILQVHQRNIYEDKIQKEVENTYDRLIDLFEEALEV